MMKERGPELLKPFGFMQDIKLEIVKLVDRFIVPPFTVLDTRQGYWQGRKQSWMALGIQGEVGRDAKAYSCNDGQQKKYDYLPDIKTGVSIFDPVLCELMYNWFCPDGGTILDPFAGGSVRGIVAAYLGYQYIGIDLLPRQVEANKVQAKTIVPDRQPKWIVWDSRKLTELLGGRYSFDFVFSCPPYFDLEQYSDDPADLSNAKGYAAFLEAYQDIVAQSLALLKPNRFACFVVSDIRDGNGFYRGLASDTIAAFESGGARLYNEAILVNVAGSLPIRVSHHFEGNRKLGREHQNVLIFYKGDPKAIKGLFG